LSHSRWNLLPPVADLPQGAGGYPPLLVQLLCNRGINRPEEYAGFLASDASLMGDPFRLPDMEAAVARIYRALLSGETIAVYGDYDADGMTATALLVQGLAALGGKAIPYIPHRQTEGHGLATAALKDLQAKGVSLVVTVDCGVTDAPQVHQARRAGLDIVVTDHHSPLDAIPEAVAVVDPKLAGSAYPFTQLAGVGVAFKLLQALYENLGRKIDDVLAATDLVAIGTIADMSPPLGENRYLIKEGLKRMNNNPRLGLRELISQTRLEAGSLEADSIGWVIAPCLNAAGRLADGLTGYNLLVTELPTEAQELAGAAAPAPYRR